MAENAVLSENYRKNVELISGMLRVGASFDIIKKTVTLSDGELTVYYVDGLIKDDTLLRLIQHFYTVKETTCDAEEFVRRHVPYVEADVNSYADELCLAVLSGAAVILGSSFGGLGIIVDARTYPARQTSEPETDKVLQGAHDGFVETLIFNTALVRRRIRDPALTFSYATVGRTGKTDVCVAYIEGRADPVFTAKIKDMIRRADCDALAMGQQSLAEVLVKRRWYNPFPKVRYTERPDTAAAQLLEGNVLIFCDTSPSAMILPTSVFDFMQETDDYALPPLTGCYLRIIRHIAFLLTVFFTPLWLLFVKSPELFPEWLAFLIPSSEAKLPIAAQLLFADFIIDALKLASLNTPSLLAGSLSAIAGLILGDFAVEVGWMIPEVILYMAFVSVVSFAQPGVELGFVFKFLRIMLVILSALFGFWGFFGGIGLIAIMLCTNKTVAGTRFYLYPLIPFDGAKLKRLFFRTTKKD